MKTPQELLEEVRELWIAHPGSYDPTDEQMRAFIEVVQRDALQEILFHAQVWADSPMEHGTELTPEESRLLGIIEALR